MLKVKSYSITTNAVREVKLPGSFEEKINLNLLAQAVHVYEYLSHKKTAKAKTRGEVTASTKKIYRQKGMGYARHGARSAPIFVGGGAAHGPKGMRRNIKLSKNIKKQALKVALSLAAKSGRISLIKINSLDKTKKAQLLISRIFSDNPVRNITVSLSDQNWQVAKFLRNIRNIKVLRYKNLNAYDLYKGGYHLIDEDVFQDQKPAKKTSEKVIIKNKISGKTKASSKTIKNK